ncbi:hypothetical protein ABZ921_33620 [Streptomyces atriruber]|uniref:Uncharacterized protein n=1 Tax=Streptomyces atriruber TaxID=545121 RepID=A0ABV3BX35_9ACTN
MFRRRSRVDREFREAQRLGQELFARCGNLPSSDYPPPDLRAPTRQDVSGFMMRWDPPLVVDGEVRACPVCGAYRNWVVFNMRDGSVWLHCALGHEMHEPRLDTAWYNRNSGPVDRFHPTLEDGLRYLGH